MEEPLAFLRGLRSLALADQAARRAALLTLRRAMGCPFNIARERLGEHRPENIIVRFHPEAPQRVVLGAHYDRVAGSTGANDNGAAVCVPLAWPRGALRRPPPFPLDVAFLNREERGQLGSRAHVARDPRRLLAMVNLGVCGAGGRLLVAPGGDARGSYPESSARAASAGARRAVRLVAALPASDNLPLEAAGVPTLAVTMAPAEDVGPLLAMNTARRRGRFTAIAPPIAETIRDGPRDGIAPIETAAMEAVLSWRDRLLSRLPDRFGV